MLKILKYESECFNFAIHCNVMKSMMMYNIYNHK